MTEDKTNIETSKGEMSMTELVALLASGTRVSDVTVSRSETRQKAEYQPNQYFASIKMNFDNLWDLLDPDVQNPTIHKLIKEQIHKEIMTKEAYLSGVLLHFQLKDKVQVWPRDPNNPAVKALGAREAWEETVKEQK